MKAIALALTTLLAVTSIAAQARPDLPVEQIGRNVAVRPVNPGMSLNTVANRGVLVAEVRGRASASPSPAAAYSTEKMRVAQRNLLNVFGRS